MAIRYKFSCPTCQSVIPLAPTQAGQTLDCSACQSSFEVPQLHVMKQLEPLADEGANGRLSSKRPSSGPGGLLVAFGLLALLVGTAAGYRLDRYASSLIFEFEDPEGQLEAQAKTLSPGGVLREWYLVEKDPDLPEWQEAPVVRYGTQGKILKKFAYGLYGLGAIGLAMTIFGLLVKPKEGLG